MKVNLVSQYQSTITSNRFLLHMTCYTNVLYSWQYASFSYHPCAGFASGLKCTCTRELTGHTFPSKQCMANLVSYKCCFITRHRYEQWTWRLLNNAACYMYTDLSSVLHLAYSLSKPFDLQNSAHVSTCVASVTICSWSVFPLCSITNLNYCLSYKCRGFIFFLHTFVCLYGTIQCV